MSDSIDSREHDWVRYVFSVVWESPTPFWQRFSVAPWPGCGESWRGLC